MEKTTEKPKSPKAAAHEKLLKFMEEECRPVKGIFKFYETPGGTTHIVMHKYPNQPRFNMVMKDGEEYEVPLWVARWLNGIDVVATKRNGKIGACGYPVYEHQLPSATLDGSLPMMPVQRVGEYRQRFGFQSMDFLAV